MNFALFSKTMNGPDATILDRSFEVHKQAYLKANKTLTKLPRSSREVRSRLHCTAHSTTNNACTCSILAAELSETIVWIE